jgi:hypothetical protein
LQQVLTIARSNDSLSYGIFPGDPAVAYRACPDDGRSADAVHSGIGSWSPKRTQRVGHGVRYWDRLGLARFGDWPKVIRAAAICPSIRRSLREATLSLVVVAATVLFTAADRAPGAVHRGVSVLARYRAADLFAGRWWRLPLSGLLAQSSWQCLCTVVIGGALYAALERTIGSAMVLVLAISHILPTLAIAFYARASGATHLLTVLDYGTSCMLMGAAGALLWLRRSRLLLIATVFVYAGDLVVNSPMTITEHVLAIWCGVGVAIVWVRANRGSVIERPGRPQAEPLAVTGARQYPLLGGERPTAEPYL